MNQEEMNKIEAVVPDGEPLPLEQELKVLQALTKIFDAKVELGDDVNIKTGFVSLVDNAHVCMVTAKNVVGNKILSKFNSVDVKMPIINYQYMYIHDGSDFSYDYMAKILNVFKSCRTDGQRETINIIAGEQLPITISNKYFTFILAPRIE